MCIRALPLSISKILRLTLFTVLTLSLLSTEAFAHDSHSLFAPTIAIDEPGVGDELDFIFANTKQKEDDGHNVHSRGFGMEFSKVIFPHFGLSIGSNYQRLRLENKLHSGFDNIEIGGKYEFYINEAENLLLSAGLVAELGKTGHRNVGAHSSTSLAPALYFGKGMGNISDEFKYLQPIAITGLISPTYCSRASKIEDVDLGLSVQYHLRNLNIDSRYSEFLNYVIPIVELPLSVCTTSHCRRKVTGSVNPGVLFSGQYMQLGIEATIPINKSSGRNVGVLAQFHFFLDNFFK